LKRPPRLFAAPPPFLSPTIERAAGAFKTHHGVHGEDTEFTEENEPSVFSVFSVAKDLLSALAPRADFAVSVRAMFHMKHFQ